MVVEYLKKIADDYAEQVGSCEDTLSELNLRYRENERFISLLEESDDPYYEAFSPRQVNLYQKRKLKELHDEQVSILQNIEEYKILQGELEDKLNEAREVLKAARKKFQRTLYITIFFYYKLYKCFT